MAKKNLVKEIINWCLCIGIAVIIGLLIVNFVMQRTIVDGDSMNSTLTSGDNLWVEKISKTFGTLKRGSIVTVHLEGEEHKEIDPLIKRIIALPGETLEIKDNKVYIDGTELEENYLTYSDNTSRDGELDGYKITLGDDEYFVMGDNRGESYDSRDLGPMKAENIIGKAFFRFYPLDRIGTV